MSLCSNFTITCGAEQFSMKQEWGDRENRGASLEIIFTDVNKNFIADYINNTHTYFTKVKFDCDEYNSSSIKALLKEDILEVV